MITIIFLLLFVSLLSPVTAGAVLINVIFQIAIIIYGMCVTQQAHNPVTIIFLTW